MSLGKILLVDSDPGSLGLLTHGLSRYGLEVNAVAGRAQALDELAREMPDVVISEVDGKSDGLSLLEQLRADPRTAELPMLLLAKGAWARRRERIRELGAQELLAKPVFVRDVAVLSRMYVGRNAHDTDFEGDLHHESCAVLLRGLLAGGRAGQLTLLPSGGRLVFRAGMVIEADLPPLTGERALMRLIAQDAGRYELSFEPISRPATINVSLPELIGRGFEHVRRWQALKPHLPPLDSILLVDFHTLATRLETIPSGIWPLLRLFDGHRTLFEVISQSNFDDITAAEAIQKLRSLGLFESAKYAWESVTPLLLTETLAPEAQREIQNAQAPQSALAPAELASALGALPPFAESDSAPLPEPTARIEPIEGPPETFAQTVGGDYLYLPPEQEAPLAAQSVLAEEASFFTSTEAIASTEEAPRVLTPSPWRSIGIALGIGTLFATALLVFRSPQEPVKEPAAPAPVTAAPAAMIPIPLVPLPSAEGPGADELLAQGQQAYDSGEDAAAIKLLEQASALRPDDVPTQLLLGLANYDMGKLGDALPRLRRVLELDAKNSRAELLTGAVYQELGKRDEARGHYESYLKLDPKGSHVDEVKALLSNLDSAAD